MAAYRSKKEMAVLLLQHGIDPTVKNNSDEWGWVTADWAKLGQSVPPFTNMVKL